MAKENFSVQQPNYGMHFQLTFVNPKHLTFLTSCWKRIGSPAIFMFNFFFFLSQLFIYIYIYRYARINGSSFWIVDKASTAGSAFLSDRFGGYLLSWIFMTLIRCSYWFDWWKTSGVFHTLASFSNFNDRPKILLMVRWWSYMLTKAI